MGSSLSLIQAFTQPVSEPPTVCTTEQSTIQFALQQLPEFKNMYNVQVTDVTNIPNNNLQCDVNFIYSSAETGFTKNETRRVTFMRTPEGDPLIDFISQRLNELNELTAISSKQIIDYYNTLNTYNKNWIKSGWKLKNATYSPPTPLWDDKLFIENIKIYNTNFSIVIKQLPNKDFAYTNDGTEFFKKYIAPLPADPIPPKANKILVPVTASGTNVVDARAIEAALSTESQAAIQNAESISDAKNTYDTYNIPRDSSSYDPPIEGDDYETVLIKLIKGYDYATSQVSNSETQAFFPLGRRDEIAGDSIPDQYDRRLLGRHYFKGSAKKFQIPSPILPQTSQPLDYNNSIGYTFSKRQQYLIDYAPIDDNNDKFTLKENMCKSLGFQVWDDKCGSPGDCCAPLQTLPKYSASASASASASGSGSASIEPFASASESASASASASAKKCGRSGIQLGGRTLTVSVPAPPVNIDTSNRMFTYKMSRPTNGTCKPAPTPKATPDELYDALRPTLLKELQTTIKNNKMFDLRCPGACLQ